MKKTISYLKTLGTIYALEYLFKNYWKAIIVIFILANVVRMIAAQAYLGTHQKNKTMKLELEEWIESGYGYPEFEDEP